MDAGHRPTMEDARLREALATFRTCMSYLKDEEGNLKITPEMIRQVGVPLFRSMDVMARFTQDPGTLAEIQEVRERAMDFMWIQEGLTNPSERA